MFMYERTKATKRERGFAKFRIFRKIWYESLVETSKCVHILLSRRSCSLEDA